MLDISASPLAPLEPEPLVALRAETAGWSLRSLDHPFASHFQEIQMQQLLKLLQWEACFWFHASEDYLQAQVVFFSVSSDEGSLAFVPV
jgi:hypothetical protein